MKQQRSMIASLIALALLGLVPCAGATSGHSGVDLASMDNSVRAADDLFRHVNGNWLAQTQIPDDLPGQTIGNLLADKSLEDRKVLLEELLKRPQQAGTPSPADSRPLRQLSGSGRTGCQRADPHSATT
nr:MULTISPECIES: hypothetical protein [unclassified Aeromonas]